MKRIKHTTDLYTRPLRYALQTFMAHLLTGPAQTVDFLNLGAPNCFP
jgi:hypothetical protein